MKKFKVIWTKHAALDLEEIINYILADSPQNATNLFQKLTSQSAKLTTNPERNRILPELKEIGMTHYREIIIKPYRIFYKLTEKEVYIFAVVDSRRDIETFLFHRLLRG